MNEMFIMRSRMSYFPSESLASFRTSELGASVLRARKLSPPSPLINSFPRGNIIPLEVPLSEITIPRSSAASISQTFPLNSTRNSKFSALTFSWVPRIIKLLFSELVENCVCSLLLRNIFTFFQAFLCVFLNDMESFERNFPRTLETWNTFSRR